MSYAAKCVQDSGLSGSDTADFRGRLNRVGLGRDDKAHRFVVTWNAFQDGNQLAYLALSIAFALDGLVFMSGLFGANAVRSSLSDLPHGRRRSATQLESIIDTALLPDRFGNARMVIETMKPISRDRDGHVGEIFIEDFHSEFMRAQARKVLTAGATINAVSRDPVTAGRYLVRAEFYEYLAEVCERELRLNRDVRDAAAVERDQAAGDLRDFREASKAESEAREKSSAAKILDETRKLESKDILSSALLPDVAGNAAIVLETMTPITNENGYSSEIIFEYDAAGMVRAPALGSDHLKMLRRVLNAGSALGIVRRAKRQGVRDDILDAGGPASVDGYEIKPELTKWLTEIHRDGGRDGGFGQAYPQLAGPSRDDASIAAMQQQVEDRHRNVPRLTSRLRDQESPEAPPAGFVPYAADAEMEPYPDRRAAKPAPAMTNVTSARRRAGSVSRSARSNMSMTWLRMRMVSARLLKSKALASMPLLPK